MGRKAVEIDKGEFQAIVTAIEEQHKPSSLSELWTLVGQSDWATKRERPYNKSTLQVKAKTMGIVITTQKGALRPPSTKKDGEIAPRKRKRKSFPLDMVDVVRQEYAPLGERRVEALIDGKLSAAIAAKCWDCSGKQRVEVANCTVVMCALWPHRPWRKQFESSDTSSHSMDDSA